MIVVDTDSLLYRAAAAAAAGCKTEEEIMNNAGLARYYLKEALVAITNYFKDEPYKLYVSSSKPTFRYKAAKTMPYKGNRKPRPVLYNACREYLLMYWNPTEIEGIEVDDHMGICGYYGVQNNYRVIMADYDKDTDQVPGYHFDIGRYTVYYVTEEIGMRNFYFQMLQGDKGCDNVPGLLGFVRPEVKNWKAQQKALAKYLPHVMDLPKGKIDHKLVVTMIRQCRTYDDYEDTLRIIYGTLSDDPKFEKYEERYNEMKELLYILRTQEEAEKMRIKYNV